MADRQRQVEKSRDGVPIWDGDSSSYQEYEEMALLWEQSIATHKRYLCAPRLITELTGSARRFTIGRHPEWVSYNGGVRILLEHLRAELGLPQVPELTEHLNRFFKNSKRRKGENMNDYITRKSEIYARAQQGMLRVLKVHGKKPSNDTTPWTRSSTRSYEQPDPWSRYHGRPAVSQATGGSQRGDEGEVPGEEQQEPEEPAGSEAGGEDDWHSVWSWRWDSATWDWRGSSQSDWWNSSQRTSSWETPQVAAWKNEAPELLPDFVQGWYLLQDANLETAERNMIVSALKHEFTFDRVAQELRAQWSDEDLKRRDMQSRGSGYWIDETNDDQGEDGEDLAWLAQASQDFNDEGLALLGEAEDEAQQALAMMEQGRKTLKEARNKQHQVRMSRKYFRTSFKSGNHYEKKNFGIQCLRCGGNHKVANCPKPPPATAAAAEAQSAPFVCFVEADPSGDPDESGFAANYGISTREAVEQGKAVVDGGATKTIGSVVAIEKIMNLNCGKKGHSGVSHLDLHDRPVFGFGNSSRDQCLSTAALEINADGQSGEVRVHALDKGEGPVLFSVESLRTLGAVIDFENDLLVFRKLNDKKIIELERSSTGHQLLPMTGDWFANAKGTAQPVPGLDAFL